MINEKLCSLCSLFLKLGLKGFKVQLTLNWGFLINILLKFDLTRQWIGNANVNFIILFLSIYFEYYTN